MPRSSKSRKKITRKHKVKKRASIKRPIKSIHFKLKEPQPLHPLPEDSAHTGFARRLKMSDDINTDYVISGRYKFRIQDPKELSKFVFEDIDDTFAGRVKKGDFLVAGENFGCGSSREQAVLALKALGIRAVIAKSFARIFYRNAFNVGLNLIECNTNYIDDEDELELNMQKNMLKNKTKGVFIDFKPTPPLLKKFLEEGGVIEYFRKHGDLIVVY